MRTIAGLMLMMTPLAVACGSDDTDASGEPPAADAAADLPDDIPDLVCATVDEASELLDEAGYTLRTVRIDGENLAVTADFVENRVNVAVETDGATMIVTEVVSLG